jgi:hypothetical protein
MHIKTNYYCASSYGQTQNGNLSNTIYQVRFWQDWAAAHTAIQPCSWCITTGNAELGVQNTTLISIGKPTLIESALDRYLHCGRPQQLFLANHVRRLSYARRDVFRGTSQAIQSSQICLYPSNAPWQNEKKTINASFPRRVNITLAEHVNCMNLCKLLHRFHATTASFNILPYRIQTNRYTIKLAL